MRIAVVVDAYAPARTSAAVQMHDLAHELAAHGHRPTVIVPAAGSSEPWTLERDGDVEILRLRAPRTKDIGYARRAIAEFVLPFAMLRGLARSPLADVRWDGVAWYSPTIFFGPFVSRLKRRSRCRAYLILRDLFPDWAVDAGIMRRGAAYHAFKRVERYQYAVADVIGVQTPANLQLIAPALRADRSQRLEVLNNWLSPRTAERETAPVLPDALRGRAIFVYAGNMGAAQGMDCLLDLAVRLRARTDVGFLFVGRGSEVPRLMRLAQEHALDNVAFSEEVEPADVPALLAQCDFGLLALDPRHTTHNIPGKFLTYLRAGLPVLARINAGNDLQTLIEQEQVGCVTTGGESDARMAELAERLLASPDECRRMGARGVALAERMFSSTAAARQLVDGLRVPA